MKWVCLKRRPILLTIIFKNFLFHFSFFYSLIFILGLVCLFSLLSVFRSRVYPLRFVLLSRYSDEITYIRMYWSGWGLDIPMWCDREGGSSASGSAREKMQMELSLLFMEAE